MSQSIRSRFRTEGLLIPWKPFPIFYRRRVASGFWLIWDPSSFSHLPLPLPFPSSDRRHYLDRSTDVWVKRKTRVLIRCKRWVRTVNRHRYSDSRPDTPCTRVHHEWWSPEWAFWGTCLDVYETERVPVGRRLVPVERVLRDPVPPRQPVFTL